MSDYIPFNTEIPIPEAPAAKVAKVAKEPDDFSKISRFSSPIPQHEKLGDGETDVSRFSSFSNHGSPNGKSHPLLLTPQYPCVVCGQGDRWDDAGIWRCRHCWPDPLTVKAQAYSLRR